MSISTRAVTGGFLVFVAATLGCGEGSTDEGVQESALEISEACVNAAPDTILGNPAQPPVVRPSMSPTTYSNPACRKHWVFQTSFPIATNTSLSFGWTDRRPRTRVECAGGTINATVLVQNGSSWDVVLEHHPPLLWNENTGECLYPEQLVQPSSPERLVTMYLRPSPLSPSSTGVVFHTPITPMTGKVVKIVMQALTPRGSTQSVQARHSAPP